MTTPNYEVWWFDDEIAGIVCHCRPGKNGDNNTMFVKTEWTACPDCGQEYRLEQRVVAKGKEETNER